MIPGMNLFLLAFACLTPSRAFTTITTIRTLRPSNSKLCADPSLSKSQRQDAILESAGYKKSAELPEDLQQLKAQIAKAKAETDAPPIDILSKIPKPLLIVIDRFLKFGLFGTTLAFVSVGLAICVEAGTVAFKTSLPPDIDSFIVDTMEPNFTPLLFVLLGFSISLGIFTSVQLGSDSANYKE
ncbi:hypothetical protein ScalyP_jg9362 [Parmales sp. scaly parma]|nr:hypothetical protein ScalyP_jg9362 [Parmales sp. scaly parma]